MQKKLVFICTVLVMLFLLAGCGAPTEPTFDFEIKASTAQFSGPGEVITYSYIVKNRNRDMDIKIVDDRLGQPCDPISLLPEMYGGPAEYVCEITYTTTAADVTAGVIRNTAVATASADSNGQTCGLFPLTAEKTASLEIALNALAAPVENPVWTIATAGCEHETNHMFFAVATGLEWLTPDAHFTYSASDGETTYACVPSPATVGTVICSGSHSQNPGPLNFCLQGPYDTGSTCQVFPDFASWLQGIACEPEWRLIGTGCHSANKIFFMIDTGYSWLSTDTEIAYTASDGETTYTCETTPGAQVYCSGIRPHAPGALTFCYQLPGDTAPTCKIFANYPSQVTGFTCEATPTVGGPTSACYAIKDTTTCWGTAGCTWNNKTGQCVPK